MSKIPLLKKMDAWKMIRLEISKYWNIVQIEQENLVDELLEFCHNNISLYTIKFTNQNHHCKFEEKVVSAVIRSEVAITND